MNNDTRLFVLKSHCIRLGPLEKASGGGQDSAVSCSASDGDDGACNI